MSYDSTITALKAFLAANTLFVSLFLFRYTRFFGNIIGWLLYKPSPVPRTPTVTPTAVTVIIPTVDPEGPDFLECCRTVLENNPGNLIIITVGQTNVDATETTIAPLRAAHPGTTIIVDQTAIASKRSQVSHALELIRDRKLVTQVVALVDDHVFWPTNRFLPTAIAPFEDARVGAVGINKRVRRQPTGFSIESFWNLLGVTYLERHNFEIRATNAIDGGVFVISGRTSLYRSNILTDPALIHEFHNEMFLFGRYGPLNPDDDNFLTRWIVREGWKIKIQYSDDARIETTLGESARFLSRCTRWARTTWRSKASSLFTDRTVWRAQPWVSIFSTCSSPKICLLEPAGATGVTAEYTAEQARIETQWHVELNTLRKAGVAHADQMAAFNTLLRAAGPTTTAVPAITVPAITEAETVAAFRQLVEDEVERRVEHRTQMYRGHRNAYLTGNFNAARELKAISASRALTSALRTRVDLIRTRVLAATTLPLPPAAPRT
ncbi:Uu.00g042300.m01.CDS01 [Anthostomella pinea]|uniref:Uu.00g042300.m01.CDS01 n=1 Tax=Anthostomella pinea TaxID=933095 RepID=A0AAI8YE45_9PEZI|nr:Uu.00g042300.m01.CDS01 [Anthostomella pinea]